MINNKKIKSFENIIGYSFKDKNILNSSLIHPSYIKEKKIKKIDLTEEFERLEFLGDRVLGLVVSSLIYSRFKNVNEGYLSKKLSFLVQKNFLYKIAIELDLDKILKFSHKKENEKMNISILADSVESIIGGIFIDSGYKSSYIFIKKFWEKHLDIKDSNLQDPKTKLQEISQQKYKKLPDYKLIKKEGPPHSPIFTVSLKVLKFKQIKSSGTSIREAEKNAASIALEMINEKKAN